MSEKDGDMKIVEAVDQDGRTHEDRVRLGLVVEGPACEECGQAFKEGDEIQHSAYGTWEEGYASYGDHYVMHTECPEPTPPVGRVSVFVEKWVARFRARADAEPYILDY